MQNQMDSSIYPAKTNPLEPVREAKITMSNFHVEALELGVGILALFFILKFFRKNDEVR